MGNRLPNNQQPKTIILQSKGNTPASNLFDTDMVCGNCGIFAHTFHRDRYKHSLLWRQNLLCQV
jgi:hypothetical protein